MPGQGNTPPCARARNKSPACTLLKQAVEMREKQIPLTSERYSLTRRMRSFTKPCIISREINNPHSANFLKLSLFFDGRLASCPAGTVRRFGSAVRLTCDYTLLPNTSGTVRGCQRLYRVERAACMSSRSHLNRANRNDKKKTNAAQFLQLIYTARVPTCEQDRFST